MIVGAGPLLGAFMSALAGCAEVQPVAPERLVTRVEVPLAVPCLRERPPRPTYRTGTGEWPGDQQASRILADDFEKAEQYGRAWEAAAAGCEVSAPP